MRRRRIADRKSSGRNSFSARNVHTCTLKIHRMRGAHRFRRSPTLSQCRSPRHTWRSRQVAQLMLQQLHQRQTGHAAQLPQVARIEGLDEYRAAGPGITVAPQGIEDRPVPAASRSRRNAPDAWFPDRRRSGRLRPGCRFALDDQLHDFIEGGHAQSPVELAILRPQFRQALAGTQRLDLREREILGEPTRHGFAVDDLSAAARRELRMLRDIGGAADLILVARDRVPRRGS